MLIDIATQLHYGLMVPNLLPRAKSKARQAALADDIAPVAW